MSEDRCCVCSGRDIHMVVTKIQNDDEVKALERESPGHLMVLLFFAPWCGSSVKAVKNFSEVSRPAPSPPAPNRFMLHVIDQALLLTCGVGVQLSTKYEDVTFAEVDCDEAEAVSVGSSQTWMQSGRQGPAPVS